MKVRQGVRKLGIRELKNWRRRQRLGVGEDRGECGDNIRETGIAKLKPHLGVWRIRAVDRHHMGKTFSGGRRSGISTLVEEGSGQRLRKEKANLHPARGLGNKRM